MKKLLLLAIVAIFSLGASAQELVTIKDAPAGTIKVYKRSGVSTKPVQDPETKKYKPTIVSQDTLANMKVVFTADNQVYIQNPLSTWQTKAWVKGTIEGNTITIPGGQCIGVSKDGTWGVMIAMMKSTDKGIVIDESLPNITYTVNGDNIKLENTTADPNIIGLGAYFSDSKYWSGRIDIASVYTLDPEATAAGIETVATEANEGEVSNVQYFDLTGKRIEKAAKGVVVKKIEYKDGSVKAEKFIAK